MRQPITALEFYRTRAVNGRAVLDGTAQSPEVWVARFDLRLYVCHHLLEGIRTVPDDATSVSAGRHCFRFGTKERTH